MILTGQKYQFETLAQFQERLDVDDQEIVAALPEEHADQLVANYEDHRKAESDEFKENSAVDWPEATSRDDLPSWAVEEWSEYINPSANQVVIGVLENRDGFYTHTRDGVLHQVIDITDTRIEAVDGEARAEIEI